MKCKICNEQSTQIFSSRILNRYVIKYFHCKSCGFLQTEEPFWLEQAYQNSINVSDTGYMQRNIYLSKKLTILLFLLFGQDAKFLDYAGGYGVFVRIMRDIGFDYYWDDKFTENLFAQGFEYNNLVKNEKISAITSFESFEHFVNPIEELEKMLSISKNIIFTTELLPYPTPDPENWWYYGLEHGQHIAFYSEKTMYFIADKFGLNYYHFYGVHILTEKVVSNSMRYLLKSTKFGLHNLITSRLMSKTWDDHLKMKSGKVKSYQSQLK